MKNSLEWKISSIKKFENCKMKTLYENKNIYSSYLKYLEKPQNNLGLQLNRREVYTLLGCMLYAGNDTEIKDNLQNWFGNCLSFYQSRNEYCELPKKILELCSQEKFYKETTSNPQKALELWKTASEAGCPFARHLIAWDMQRSGQDEESRKLYLQNIDFIPSAFNFWSSLKDKEKLLERIAQIKELVAQNFTPALNDLGFCYYKGIGVDINHLEAFKCYEKAAEKGSVNALCNLGYFYEEGIGVAKDSEKAFKCYTQAAEKGNVNALYNLGFCYYKGIGVDINHLEAFKCYEKAAEKGSVKALGSLGYFYEEGIGVAKDSEKAFKCYTQAAEKGNVNALYNLGFCYEKGFGCEENLVLALEFYAKAAEHGHKDAQVRLSFYHRNLWSVTKNLLRALS